MEHADLRRRMRERKESRLFLCPVAPVREPLNAKGRGRRRRRGGEDDQWKYSLGRQWIACVSVVAISTEKNT